MKNLLKSLTCLGIIVFLSLGCSEYAEETAISELALSATNLAEKRDIGGLENLATLDFELAPDGLDLKGTKWALYRFFRQHSKFSVLIPKPEIDVDLDDETAELRMPIAIGPRNYNSSHLDAFDDDHVQWKKSLGRDVDLFQLEASLVKERDMWFVRKIRIERQ